MRCLSVRKLYSSVKPRHPADTLAEQSDQIGMRLGGEDELEIRSSYSNSSSSTWHNRIGEEVSLGKGALGVCKDSYESSDEESSGGGAPL
jgi:hypothetical protein